MGKSLLLFVIMLITGACIDRISFDIGELNENTLVIQGSITDQPGPYEVTMYVSSNIGDDLSRRVPYSASRVTIIDDVGNVSELSSSQGDGIYRTSQDSFTGIVGRKYHIRIEAFDGTIFESTPDEMMPVDEIDSLYWEWDSYLPINGPTQYGFKVYFDTHVSENGYIRWRFVGTYMAESFPIAKSQYPRCSKGPNAYPIPCSGYTEDDHYGKCTCCICWVRDTNNIPQLSDDYVLRNGQFPNIEIGYVPFDKWRFHFLKYMIMVRQESLTQQAYEFWKVIRDQKRGSESLFQPAFGSIRTNIFATNSERKVIGIFYSSSIKSKFLFLTPKDSPIPVPELNPNYKEECFFWDACDQVWPNSSRTPPPEWK